MSQDKFGTFEDIVNMTPELLRPITIRLQELLLSIHPHACVVVRLGDRAATFGVGPKRMSEGYCLIIPHAKWVNLGFYQGASLPDPDGLLEGTGKKMRHVKIRTREECENPKLKELIGHALDERKAALGHT